MSVASLPYSRRRTTKSVLTKDAMEYLRPHMMWLNESAGLVVVDEGSGEWLTDSDVDASSTASTVPETWGPVTSVYAINVPPWYD